MEGGDKRVISFVCSISPHEKACYHHIEFPSYKGVEVEVHCSPYSDFGDSIINDKQQMKKKVFVSGCYDLLHSGHVEFFQQASRYGDLYVGIGSDATYQEYKHRKPMFPQEERLFMVKNIKAVKDTYINEGSGVIDFLPTLDKVKPDVFVVNAEGGSDEKRRICKERGIDVVCLPLPVR